MGLFSAIFGNRPKEPKSYDGVWKMLDGYTPHFSSWGGSIYESELIRAAIEVIATHVGKLRIEISGTAKPALRNKLSLNPNEFQTWEQFNRRLTTILLIHNTAFLVPVWDRYGEISGIYAPLPDRCTIADYAGKPFLRYEFSWGQTAAVELEYCGILNRHTYRNDFFGESNRALFPTLDLIKIQNQGIEEGVKSAASYRFMAQLMNFSKSSDIAAERKRFTEENFSRDAKGGGLLLFPNTYKDIKQIEVKPWVIDDKQMQAIKDGVFQYFNVNEDILTGKAYGDAYAAFYESTIESIAIQYSEVLSRMLYTYKEQLAGNRVMFTANRLQFMTNADKLAVSAQMADRGLMTRNEIREIWNLAPLPEPLGSQLPVRGEYYNANDEDTGEEAATE
jgi:HK97 family phage portal protein